MLTGCQNSDQEEAEELAFCAQAQAETKGQSGREEVRPCVR